MGMYTCKKLKILNGLWSYEYGVSQQSEIKSCAFIGREIKIVTRLKAAIKIAKSSVSRNRDGYIGDEMHLEANFCL